MLLGTAQPTGGVAIAHTWMTRTAMASIRSLCRSQATALNTNLPLVHGMIRRIWHRNQVVRGRRMTKARPTAAAM